MPFTLTNVRFQWQRAALLAVTVAYVQRGKARPIRERWLKD
jgi:hypothetical protein